MPTKSKKTDTKKSSRPWGADRKAPGPLYVMLLETFPTFLTADGYLSFKELSEEIGYSHQALRRWVDIDKLSVRLANRLIAKSEGRLTPEQVWPFMFEDGK